MKDKFKAYSQLNLIIYSEKADIFAKKIIGLCRLFSISRLRWILLKMLTSLTYDNKLLLLIKMGWQIITKPESLGR